MFEYCGEVIGHAQWEERRGVRYPRLPGGCGTTWRSSCVRVHQQYKQSRHTYYMMLGKDLIIDATCKGSVARFVNHSCSPNCKSEEVRRLRAGARGHV